MGDVIRALVLLAGAALASFALIRLLQPVLHRYALARPNARSSHSEPTPQGGGIVVVAVTIAATLVAGAAFQGPAVATLIPILGATVVLALIGVTDDIRPLEALPRLGVQALAAIAVLVTLPSDIHLLSALPLWLERTLLFFGLVWFVNLTNFMDGIDWITVAEVVPLTAALGVFGLTGALPVQATSVALALCGAMLGFAPYNRPVARLFLGDVGSLPIGLLLGWMLVLLGDQHLAAALLLPMYYAADATLTLLRRLMKGERVTQAHRSHFYQRALIGGLSVPAIVARVFALNVALIALAAVTLWLPSLPIHAAALATGAALTGFVLYGFSRR